MASKKRSYTVVGSIQVEVEADNAVEAVALGIRKQRSLSTYRGVVVKLVEICADGQSPVEFADAGELDK